MVENLMSLQLSSGLVGIVAPPGEGKTSLLLKLAAGRANQKPGVFLSSKMKAKDFYDKLFNVTGKTSAGLALNFNITDIANLQDVIREEAAEEKKEFFLDGLERLAGKDIEAALSSLAELAKTLDIVIFLTMTVDKLPPVIPQFEHTATVQNSQVVRLN